MGNEGKKRENGNEPKTIKGWIALIIPCISALAGVIYRGRVDIKLQKMKDEQEKRMYELQNEQEQSFYCNSEMINKFGIEYKQYEITSEPVIEGYHVLVYPYVVSGEEKDNKVYIPIVGEFTSDEYKADRNGNCKLLKEVDEYFEDVENDTENSSEVKILIAIQYAEDGTTRERKVYDIGDGQLVEAEKELVIGVLQAWENEKVDS